MSYVNKFLKHQQDFIDSTERIAVFTGGMGAGKSFSLIEIARRSKEQKRRFVFFASCAPSLGEARRSLHETWRSRKMHLLPIMPKFFLGDVFDLVCLDEPRAVDDDLLRLFVEDGHRAAGIRIAVNPLNASRYLRSLIDTGAARLFLPPTLFPNMASRLGVEP